MAVTIIIFLNAFSRRTQRIDAMTHHWLRVPGTPVACVYIHSYMYYALQSIVLSTLPTVETHTYRLYIHIYINRKLKINYRQDNHFSSYSEFHAYAIIRQLKWCPVVNIFNLQFITLWILTHWALYRQYRLLHLDLHIYQDCFRQISY